MIGIKVHKFRFANRLFLLLERFRLKLHFVRVIACLESRNKKHLSSERQKTREENIEFLQRYKKNGDLPTFGESSILLEFHQGIFSLFHSKHPK